MTRIAEGGDDWSPVTDFEKSTHEALYSMIAQADPDAVNQVGNTLAAASTQIQSIADDLSQHIAGLQWTGSAADAFTGWARQVVSATDTLSVYANNTSVAVAMAGQQLSSTKAGMPPVPYADMATVKRYQQQQRFAVNSGLNLDGTVKDPSMSGLVVTPPGGVTPEQAYRAQSSITSAFQEALGQMEGLGGSYVGAVATMGVSTIPTFPPLPGTLMPPKGAGQVESLSNASVSSGSPSGSSGYGRTEGTGSDSLGATEAAPTPPSRVLCRKPMCRCLHRSSPAVARRRCRAPTRPWGQWCPRRLRCTVVAVPAAGRRVAGAMPASVARRGRHRYRRRHRRRRLPGTWPGWPRRPGGSGPGG
ncbi:WXG100 family type VII secretion target [Streptacidiphilus sp. 4-A2]|nr:WXG100 family type VII secretion target [Streptacidiphilus sp. 4-A2]